MEHPCGKYFLSTSKLLHYKEYVLAPLDSKAYSLWCCIDGMQCQAHPVE